MSEPSTSREALLEMLDGLIKQASDTLREYGYDGDWENVATCWPQFMKLGENRKNQPRPVAWSAEVIRRAMRVRFALNNPNDYKPTALALSMAKFIQAAEKAKFSYYIPDIELGESRRKSLKKFGHERGREQTITRSKEWEKWKAEADRLMVENPILAGDRKKSELARKIKKNLNLPDSIRAIRSRI